MKVAIASDHAGFEMKEALANWLQTEEGVEVCDMGTYSPESVDYADVAHPLALKVEAGDVDFGVALCGSGNGISMTLNKHQGIRCALCWEADIARLARHHNDANIIALPARFISLERAKELVWIFLNSPFDGGRHARRIEKIPL